MSVPATFGDIFTQVCRAKSSGSDIAIADNTPNAFTLVSCGHGDGAFAMSRRGVRFKDVGGRDVEYSWEELDFVLPGDLSMAADKLRTSTDLHEPAEQIAKP